MALRQVINPMSTEHVPGMSHRLLNVVSVDIACRPQARDRNCRLLIYHV